MENQKDQVEMDKEQVKIKCDHLAAELDALKQEQAVTVQRFEKQKESLQTRLAQLERGMPFIIWPH